MVCLIFVVLVNGAVLQQQLASTAVSCRDDIVPTSRIALTDAMSCDLTQVVSLPGSMRTDARLNSGV